MFNKDELTKKHYLKKRYYRLSALGESFFCFLYNFITLNYKLSSYKILLYKLPIPSTVYYNKFGVLLISIRFFFSFIIPLKKNTIFKFSTKENLVCKVEDKKSKRNFGNDEQVWPTPALCKYVETTINDKFINEISKSYFLSLKNSELNLKNSIWWEEFSIKFKKIFFYKKKLKKKIIEKFFKVDFPIDIFNASSPLTNKNKIEKYFAILNLIANYHNLYNHIRSDILISFSESKLFEADSIIYRNQYLNERALRCAYYLSQIKQHSELSYNQKFIFLDLGGGYGLLTRYLLSYFYNSKGILIELPETCILASYYLKKNFPKKKIKILSNLNKNFTINQKSFEDTDIFILPTWSISKLSDNLIDLVVNTASLGELSKEYGEYYLRNINRIAKRYFYSHNRVSAKNSIWGDIKNAKLTEEKKGYGHYNYNFEGLWNINLYNSSPGWHLEFLGEKI